MIPQPLYTWSTMKDPLASIATTNELSNQSIILSICYANMNDMYECVKLGSIKIYASILQIGRKLEITPGSY